MPNAPPHRSLRPMTPPRAPPDDHFNYWMRLEDAAVTFTVTYLFLFVSVVADATVTPA